MNGTLRVEPLQLGLALDGFTVVERRSRRARHIRIEVGGDGRVLLTIPHFVSRAEAHAFLESRRDWVLRHLRSLPPVTQTPDLKWDGSDRIPLRGVDTPLKWVPAVVRGVSVRVRPDTILVYQPLNASARARRAALLRALRETARDDARRMLAEEGARLGLYASSLRIGDQKTLWGSCGADGAISLNWRLLLAPPDVFRYVVIHELCHLRWHSHGPRFWGLVARQCPEFDGHRQWLNQNAARLQRLLAA